VFSILLQKLSAFCVFLKAFDQEGGENAVHLDSFIFDGANINKVLLTFQGEKVYILPIFLIIHPCRCQKHPFPPQNKQSHGEFPRHRS
ncbi:MAG: hypothetical protein IKS97_10900, partial [Fibrobacter sp.]|nr:hypothetical protein [Fibrobacter sp.]